jgi:hypothetical protein
MHEFSCKNYTAYIKEPRENIREIIYANIYIYRYSFVYLFCCTILILSVIV